MAWNACEQMEGCKYCATPIIMEFTYWIWAARKLGFEYRSIWRTCAAILRIFFVSRIMSGNGLPTRCSFHVAGSGVLRFCSAFTTYPRKCMPSLRRSVTYVFSCDSSSFILYLKYFVSSRLTRNASFSVEVKTTQSSAYRKLYFGVTPAHFSRLESLRLYLHRRCGSIYQRPTYQSKSFR